MPELPTIVNKQPRANFAVAPEGRLDVFDFWETIQGEGPFSGRRAIFVRLAGCNLQCPGCDTDYTSKHTTYIAESLSARINSDFKHHKDCIDTSRYNPLLVITGGEPFRQNFGPFARLMLTEGWEIQVETNGTVWHDDIPMLPITFVCSPKYDYIHEELKPHIKALKYVIRAGEVDSDGLPLYALGYKFRPARPREWFKGEIWIQPCDEGDPARNKAYMDEAVAVCMKHGYRLGLQIHKLIGVQ